MCEPNDGAQYEDESKDAAFQQLESLLLNNDEDTRYEAAQRLLKTYPPSQELVISWAQSTNPRLREMACWFYSRMDYSGPQWTPLYPDGTPLLVDLLANDQDEEVRDAAACALGHRTEKCTVHALVRAADDTSAMVRHGVVFALGSFYQSMWSDEDIADQRLVGDTLLRLMDDPDEDVRDWATFGIHQVGYDTPESQARLWKALDDLNPEVRGEAAEGLALFGDRDLIPRLKMLLCEDEHISPCYFAAAEVLGDTSLLSEVMIGVERWRETMEEDEQLLPHIVSAVRSLGGSLEDASNDG